MEVISSIREDDGKTQVTVTLTAEEVKPYIDGMFKELGKNRIRGFRPGKAPRKVIEQTYGGHEAIYDEIAERVINGEAGKAADSQDVLFITDPEFEDFETIQDGEPFTFSMYAKVKPEVQLLSAEPVEITLPPETATDEEIDAQVEALRNYYYTFETVEGRAAANGDHVMCAISATANGEDIPALASSSRLIELGSGMMPESFDKEVIGMNTGDTKEFDFELESPADYDLEENQPIHATVTLNEIRNRVVPELDEEFAKKIGVDTIEDLRKQIADAINKQREEQLPAMKERRCVDALAKRIHGEVPQSYLNFTRDDVLRDFWNNLQQQGLTFDQFLANNGITADDFQKDLEAEAKEVAEQSLALDALYKELGLEITEEEIDAEFQVVDNPEEVRKQWEEAGRMASLREAVRRSKASKWLVENAIVKVDNGEETDED